MKARLRFLLITLLLGGIVYSLPAQSTAKLTPMEDVVYKTDGSILRGKIKYQNDDNVTLEILGGSTWVIKRSDILKITLEKANLKARKIRRPRGEISYKTKGYYNLSEFMLLVGDYGTFSLHTINGHQFNPHLAVGGGVGLSFWEEGFTLPLFVDVRGDLLKDKPITPHYYVEGGYALPLSKAERYLGWRRNGNIVDDKVIGGPLYGGGFGIRINTPSQISWLITAGFNHQEIEIRYKEQFWQEDNFRNIVQTFTHNRIALRLGIMF